jgi:hypothetical protein
MIELDIPTLLPPRSTGVAVPVAWTEFEDTSTPLALGVNRLGLHLVVEVYVILVLDVVVSKVVIVVRWHGMLLSPGWIYPSRYPCPEQGNENEEHYINHGDASTLDVQ